MPTIVSAADLGTYMDDLVNCFHLGRGVTAGVYGLGIGDGVYGSTLAAADLKADILSMTSSDFIAKMAARTNALYTRLSGNTLMKAQLAGLLSAIDGHVRQCEVSAAITNLHSYLTFLNVDDSTKWQCLMPYQFRDLYYAWKNAYPSIHNVYFEILYGATYANGLRKLVVGTGQTAGTDVDYTKYCGGVPYVIASGITGSGVVTVTGSQFNPADQTVTAGKTWTATVTGNDSFALAVGTASANSLIVAVSNVAAAGGISAGTIYAEARRPSGRQLLS